MDRGSDMIGAMKVTKRKVPPEFGPFLNRHVLLSDLSTGAFRYVWMSINENYAENDTAPWDGDSDIPPF